MNAARHLLQILGGGRQARRGVGELRLELLLLGRHDGLRSAQLERERDETLLGAVVQIALDAPAASSAAVTMRARDAVSWARLSALAIAVARSSVNSAMRPSIPSGTVPALSSGDVTPQRRPSTTIGAPSLVCHPPRSPEGRQTSPSIRAVRPVRNTVAAMFSPAGARRVPT